MKIGIGVISHGFPQAAQWWDRWLQLHPEIVGVISNDDEEPPITATPLVHGPSLGVAHTKNRALKALMGRGAELLLLVEDDCRIADDAILGMLTRVAESAPHMMLGPVTEWSGTWAYTGEEMAIAGLTFAEYRRKREPQDSPGVLSVVTRDAVEKVGGLDARFIGRGHAHGEWTSRIFAHTESALPSPFWNCLDAENCLEFVERPRSEPHPDTDLHVRANAKLRADLTADVPQRTLPIPNLDYRIDYDGTEPISVCISLKDRATQLSRCLDTVQGWFRGEPDNEVVIADFGSTDCDVEYQLGERSLPGTVVHLDGYFSRSRGLHNAALAARHDLLLFLDADMLVPWNLGHVIRTYVDRGSCLFPVCTSLAQNGQLLGWRYTGFGMVAIHRDDYDLVGGWDLGRRRWGGEDDDLHWHCDQRLEVHRVCVTDLIHQWHPTSPEFKEQHMDPDAKPREDWTPPDTRDAVREPIEPIRVPAEMLRDSLDRWAFHVETAYEFMDNPKLPAKHTAYYHGVIEYKRNGGKLWAEIGTGDDVDPQKVEYRVERFRKLFTSIQHDGYDERQPISVMITGSGKVQIVDGHHRAACALVLGIPEIPAKVTHRHPEWVLLRDVLFEQYKAEQLYTAIDHPDFDRWTVARDVEYRANALLDLMAPPETVLDVGCCTGGVAMALSRAGMRVTAIERHERVLAAAQKIERVMGGTVSWRHGEAWDMELGRRDWAICLSVLHHAVKANEHGKAMAWLKRRGKRLVIEMADGSESQMEGHDLPATQEGLGPWLAELSGMKVTPILRGVPKEARRSASDRRWLWLLEK